MILIQQTLSENNLVEVTENLTKVVAQAEDQVDQSENNLAVVSKVLAETVELLNASNIQIDATVSLLNNMATVVASHWQLRFL